MLKHAVTEKKIPKNAEKAKKNTLSFLFIRG